MRERGFSLVEALVAMTVGLLLTAVALHLWQAGQRAQRAGDGRWLLEEQGQYALDILGRALRQAGYRHALVLRQDVVRPDLPFAALGCQAGQFGSGLPHAVYPRLPAALPCVSASPAGTAASADALLVLHESGEPAGLRGAVAGEWLRAEPTRGLDVTCQGNRLPLVRLRADAAPQWLPATHDASLPAPPGTIADVALAMNHYYVDTTPRPGLLGGRLMCVGIGRGGQAETPQPLVQGVESMVVHWGLDRDGDGSIDALLRAGQLGAADWPGVVSVVVCLLVRGEVRGAAARAVPGLDCLGQPLAAPNAAGTVQRSFSATFALRNAARHD